MYHFFDLGGTLIDSVLRKKRAIKEYSGDNASVDFELLDKIDVAGTRTRDMLNHLLGGKLPINELNSEYEKFREIEQSIEPTMVDGAEYYLDKIYSQGEGICLVTNSRIRVSIEDIIKNIPSGLRGYFPEDSIVCRIDEMDPKKPNPFLYRKAIESKRIAPDNFIAYEDTRRGLQAARSAGIFNCVGVISSDLHDEQRLLKNGAMKVISSYLEL